MNNTKEDNHGLDQAKAQLSSIKEMIENRARAIDDDNYDAVEEIEQQIQEDPLSVQKIQTYEILLCTGGPAVRIIGELNEYQEPETAILQHQDWFKPWTELNISAEDQDTLLEYTQMFYFAE